MKINQRLIIMREAITKIVPMLSQKDVKVTLRGMKAFVEFDPKSFQPVRVNLPYLPDDASDELVDAVQGYLDHEVGHILHSDPREIARAVKHDKVAAFLHNAIEDPMIAEKGMSERFIGSAHNLSNLMTFFLGRVIEKNYREAVLTGDRSKITSALIVPAVRAWAGQQQSIDYMEDKWHEIRDWVDLVGQDLIKKIPDCKNSTDACDLAIKIFDRIKKDDAPEEDPGEQDDTPEDADDGQGSEGDGEDSNKDDEDSKKPKKSEESDSDDQGQGEGSAKGEGEDSEGEGQDTEDDAQGGEEGEGDDGKPTTFGNMRPKMNSGFRDDLIAAINKEKGFDEATAEALTERAQQECKNSQYLIFTRDDDLIEPMQTTDKDFLGIPQMQEAVDDMLGPLGNEIERMIKARSAATWTGGHRTGRLNGSTLTRVRFGRDDVFRRKQENNTKDVAVSLVTDNSGSMTDYNKLTTAMYTAYALSSILDRLGIVNEVIGFTTRRHSAQVERDLRQDPKMKEYCRYEAIYMPVYKGFGERMGADVRARFVKAVEHNNLCRSNVDGESVMLAYRRLAARRETRKIMLVLSDGQPAVSGGGNLNDHLKSVVRQIEASGTDVVGLGIMDQSVRQFYKKHIIMKSVRDLPAVVSGELKTLLTK